MPSHPQSNGWDDKESVSRTMLYKKITKPLLERQRRARINRCLDELKELMSAALAAEGENLTKLEKADVLELTVRHLHQLHREGELSLNGFAAASSGPAERRRYQGGFLACAQQVASYVMKTPGLEPGLGQRLLAHLARCSQQLTPDGHPMHPPGHTLPPGLGLAGIPLLADSSFALPAAGREYSITAQFQVYRPSVDESPNASADSLDDSATSHSPKTAPHIPKKRYAHFQFERESSATGRSVSECSDADAGPSGYVVESRVVPRPPSSADGKDGDMWRPW